MAGTISFLSPCVLPLVPGYIAYISGRSAAARPSVPVATPSATLLLSSLFGLGFTTVFVALAASATALGQLLLSYRYEANLIAGIVVIAFGVIMLGLVRWSWLQRDLRFHLNLPRAHPITAYLLGLAFAFGWGTILTATASSATLSQGVALLLTYSLGLGIRARCGLDAADHDTHQAFEATGTVPTDRRRRGDGCHGCCDDHRAAHGVLLLAARDISYARADRLSAR